MSIEYNLILVHDYLHRCVSKFVSRMVSQPLIYAVSKIISLSQLTILQQLFGGHCGLPNNIYSILTLPLQYACIFNSRFAIGSGLHTFIGIGAGPREPGGGIGVGRCRSGGGRMNERSSYVTRSRVES